MKTKNVIIIILSIFLLILSIMFVSSIRKNNIYEENVNKYELQIDCLNKNSYYLSTEIQILQDSINKLKINLIDLNKEKEELHNRLSQPIYSKTFDESVVLLKINLENEKALNNINY